MLTITEEPDFIIITATGTLTKADYDQFVPADVLPVFSSMLSESFPAL